MFTTGTVACSASVVELVLVARAQADHRGVAGQDQRGVAHGLAARELQLVGAQDHRVAAELEHAGLERRARAGRRLVEQQRDRAALERPRGLRRRLQRRRAVQQQVEPVGVEFGAGEEVGRGLECGH